MSNKNVNPKIDFVFRRLFGSEENKDLLIALINSVVEPDLRLTDVTIKSPFVLADYQPSKNSILDIKAVDQDGTRYDIEMQIAPDEFYGNRAVYYLSKIYTEEMDAGDNYSTLNTAIGIHFLDFTYFPDDDRVVRQFMLKDVETNDTPKQLGNLRLYFVEMGKFKKDWPQVRTALDRWVSFLNKAEKLRRNRLPAQLADDPAIVKAVAELERIGLNPAERKIYEAEVKARMANLSELKTARDEGAQQHMQQHMLHLMTRRMGDAPGEIVAKVSRLKTQELDDLNMALFDIRSYADVEKWLTRH